ncbi:General secretory system II protein E domain protein [Anaeromyxobacter sp. K]|uniref:GspE/PulE/PilB domain-containing protein n=1 Tax=Anaeromyxobacter sp. (strain K) TaxID=447217 RepID=UPI00015F901C|nr:general secretion pathway protein GspE [Anaeromyxobacter sp. K]ACG72479.1 General secretory system II protein E domain protein [Anaeromyxobacter sp. K]
MRTRLGELLLRAGACTPAAIRDALENQVIFGGRLGTNLLELGAVDEGALARALGQQHGVPALFGEVRLEPEAVAVLRAEVADRCDVVPFLLAGRRLAVLAVDPSDLRVLDEVAFAAGREVHALVAPEARVWALLRRAYGIERQLRGIEVDFDSVRRAAGARVAPAAPSGTPGSPGSPAADLMTEDDFEAVYGRTGAFALAGAAPASAAGEELPELPEDAILELEPADEVAAPPPEVLAALSGRAGHAPPARLVPAAPARPEPEPSPLDFREAVRFLEGVEERGAIARTVLRHARSRFRRALLLTIQHGAARGWAGMGDGVSADAVRRLRLPLGAPGIVDTVVRTRAHFLGPIPKTDANVLLLKRLGGGVPANALVLPILARGRVVNVFYADAGRGGLVDAGAVGELLILATRISQSYEALLARVR